MLARDDLKPYSLSGPNSCVCMCFVYLLGVDCDGWNDRGGSDF